MSAATEHRALAQRYRHLPEVVVRAGAAEIQRSLLVRLDRDTGGDRVLSGASKRRRTRLGVTLQVISSSASADAEVKPSRRGASQWSWLEYGTGVRVVGEDGEHVKIGDKWFTGPWSAGRSPAKHTFTEGCAAGIHDAEKAMAAAFDKAAR